MTMCFCTIILPLGVVLSIMLFTTAWPVLFHVPPMLLPETFADIRKTTKSFETWGGEALQNLGGSPASLRLRVVQVVRALGPVYTEERRQCKQQRSICRRLDRNAFLVSAPGFNQGVFFLIAEASQDVRSGTVLDVQALRVRTLFRSLQLE